MLFTTFSVAVSCVNVIHVPWVVASNYLSKLQSEVFPNNQTQDQIFISIQAFGFEEDTYQPNPTKKYKPVNSITVMCAYGHFKNYMEIDAIFMS